MSERIGIGIIGAGFMGMLHARALSQLPDARVIGVSDPAIKERPKLPGQKEPLEVFPDHGALLARKDIQAVVIASPENLHRDAVVDAAKAGKHILLEKPIATTLEDADAMIGEAARRKVKLMMAH
ncbi:MAG: Gfo/Idh/MocA family oxidoreductase, partial [Spirochaetes bacterium]|nr:Gfo/Idh/MocA family oxidoreductase [Spirochaetota bacterium]